MAVSRDQMVGSVGSARSTVARHPQTRTAITVVIAVLVVLVAVAATLAVVAIGESGSRAVWLNSF